MKKAVRESLAGSDNCIETMHALLNYSWEMFGGGGGGETKQAYS